MKKFFIATLLLFSTQIFALDQMALLRAYDELGSKCEEIGEADRAFYWYTTGMKTHPAFYESRFVRWGIKSEEQFVEKLQQRRPPPAKGVPWEPGKHPPGTLVYVYAEEGYGDTIQFSRYLNALLNDGYKVIFRPQPALEELYRHAFGSYLTIDTSLEEESLPFDAYVSLLSLPAHYLTPVNDIPYAYPYLQADPAKVAQYQEQMQGEGLQVGIYWQGYPHRFNDVNRSVKLDQLTELLTIPGVTFYSLQVGHGKEQLEELPEGIELVDLGQTFETFDDTAAAVTNLDLLISVDTSMAHLGGALGVETWTLIPFFPDWRWFQDGTTTPWYAKMTLFRQEICQDWTPTIEKLQQALKERCTKEI